MFSGIIEKLARVTLVASRGGSLEIELQSGWPDLALGESIAVNGVCLTVTQFDETGLARFFISPETLARTNLGGLAVGQFANLERAVTLETRLSGHLVQGHIDGLARLVERVEADGAWRHVFLLPEALGRYCVEKGSIALNGISLTINGLEDRDEGVAVLVTIIPHTWEHTNLNALPIGDALNVEIDVMAKYVERLCLPYLKP
ncbi:riboflavin synthase [Devosia sp. ZB163]|uniref:riboflavin synthase n=1 Tax=Devosia sp. ZB163 TaxID=3025938 RepID=UPI002360B24A|nr:riboflavin synthase [Devosia sp. ZB163]MDC9825364.1 riboflavin synthase [Devosia sp. ZB163]